MLPIPPLPQTLQIKQNFTSHRFFKSQRVISLVRSFSCFKVQASWKVVWNPGLLALPSSILPCSQVETVFSLRPLTFWVWFRGLHPNRGFTHTSPNSLSCVPRRCKSWWGEALHSCPEPSSFVVSQPRGSGCSHLFLTLLLWWEM